MLSVVLAFLVYFREKQERVQSSLSLPYTTLTTAVVYVIYNPRSCNYDSNSSVPARKFRGLSTEPPGRPVHVEGTRKLKNKFTAITITCFRERDFNFENRGGMAVQV